MSKSIIKHLARQLAKANVNRDPVTFPALTFNELGAVFRELEELRK